MPVCEPGKKCGIFGGSFDPVHNGHISLAKQILKLGELSRVLFVPALHHPFKADSIIASYDQRREMLQLALSDCPEFYICDIERDHNLSGYTLETVRAIKQLFPDCEFSFIVGDDLLDEIKHWRNYPQILDEVMLFVGRRLESPAIADKAVDRSRIREFTTDIIKVSATEIKSLLANGEMARVAELVPKAVADYIQEHGLYQ